MEIADSDGVESPSLAQSPPTIPPDIQSECTDPLKRSIVSRPGFGSSGRPISLLTNHFKVSVRDPDAIFYQYNVSVSSEDNVAVDSKRVGRKITDKLYQTYQSDLSGKQFAYDGEKNLYTVGPLPQNNFEFTVVLEESIAKSKSSNSNGSPDEPGKRTKHSLQSRSFKVEISYVAKIPLISTSLALQGAESSKVQDSLRVLDTILRHQAANRGCLLIRQSFFHDDLRMFSDVGGGLTGVRGFNSAFHPTQGGLSLNMDVATTVILKPGPVKDFLLENQNLKDLRSIDWGRARKALKNLRVKASHNHREFKITGLSDKPCHLQLFTMNVKAGGSDQNDGKTLEITVSDYFAKHCNIELTYSNYMPCLDVGKPNRPNYLPVELCSLVSLQRYKKALSAVQKASLVEKSRQKPLEKIRVVTDAVKHNHYDEDPLLVSCGISIENELTHIDGRVLDPPKLKIGNSEDCLPCNGKWNFNKKQLLKPVRIEHWALVNFSSPWDSSHLSRELISCGRNTGVLIERPYTIIDEDPKCRKASPAARVAKMFEQIMDKLPAPPEFLLCVLPERKSCDIYGPWKKKCLSNLGIANQCISPTKLNDKYLANVLLKINTKLGGINSLLEIEHSGHIPFFADNPTMILGMDVSHGPLGRPDIPSIAAVVGSGSWPLISRYKAAVRTQSPKVEMIESLFKPLPNGEDDGIMRELLLNFYETSNGRKPTQIIVFRDGVSESQFSQVMDVELNQMIKAYQHLGDTKIPKFTLIVAQKNHHTKLFQASSSENVLPGTVVDTGVVHPRNYDFYMCPQGGTLGTSRPAHYHVLLDEIGFSPDDLQNLIHSLSYIYQRSTNAVSIVAPICYAHLAAQQMGQFLKFEDSPEALSSEKSMLGNEGLIIPAMPRLHKDVAGSMFFC